MKKRNIKNIVVVLGVFMAFSITACDDSFLDKSPYDKVTNATYWKTEAQLRKALFPCYEGLKYDQIINIGEACADNVIWGDVASGLNKVSGGKHTALDNFPFYTYWSNIYNSIFCCNNFLDHYNNVSINQDIKDAYAAEVKVIRALQYFWLTSLWRDVPLLDHVITPADAYQINVDKNVIVEWILNDLDWAASKLETDIPKGENLGRINRWGALALKARIALQNEMWDLAAATAKEIIDHSPYALWDYAMVYHLEGNVENNAANNESIIYSIYKQDIRMNNLTNFTCTPVNYIRLNAGKTLVDAFLCKDGKPAIKGLEYYKRNDIAVSPLYSYPEQHYVDYFKNRDPRMYLTLYCPGDKWPGGDDGDLNKLRNDVFQLPRFESLQRDRRGANTRTGFYYKKYNTPELAGQVNKDHNNINVIRYPEVLLIYAEALFNKQGKTLTQSQIDMTINKLRNRVGMHPMLLTELDAWHLDLQTELRRERRIEMSFDGMRYFDVLRWKEGFRLGRAIVGPSLKVCLNDLGNCPYIDGNGEPLIDEFGDVVFDASVAEGGARNFNPDKHYVWPIPNKEINKNPNLKQNEEWK